MLDKPGADYGFWGKLMFFSRRPKNMTEKRDEMTTVLFFLDVKRAIHHAKPQTRQKEKL